jgi:hypothetical protein
MPSNNKLIEKAESLAKQLGVSAEVEGKNNQQLVEEVKRLQAIEAQQSNGASEPEPQEVEKSPEPEDEASKDDTQDSEPEPQPEPKPKAKKADGPVVADGKSITTLKRGILGAGEAITAKDLGGGDAAFKALKKKGFIVG